MSESDADQEVSTSDSDDCELSEDNSSDEEIKETPSQSAVPSSQSETTFQQVPFSASVWLVCTQQRASIPDETFSVRFALVAAYEDEAEGSLLYNIFTRVLIIS
jgi:hypothetical protein